MTDRYGVIGHPIGHSKSPVIHGLFARQTGQDISYEAFDIPPEQLVASLERFRGEGIRGLNVTVPHKTAVVPLVTRLTERAKRSGAVNTLTFRDSGELEGDNTDGVGLITDLRNNLGLRLEDKRLLLLGAGGAARGIIPALLESKPHRLLVANRTLNKATDLVERFVSIGKISACTFDGLGGRHFDLVLNATSAGLNGEVPPFTGSIIASSTVCYDLSYAMTPTPFIYWARQQGAKKAYQGWGMLVEQAAESFLVWRGVRPETARVRARLPG